MLDKLLSRVEAGRLGRGLAGLRQGWQFQVVERSAAAVKGMVSYSGQGSAARKQKTLSGRDQVHREWRTGQLQLSRLG